jgi:hypothetical protein
MSTRSDFERAAEEEEVSFFRQFLLFLQDNKKWWMLPIFAVLGMIGLLVLFAGSGAAPFIYTIF